MIRIRRRFWILSLKWIKLRNARVPLVKVQLLRKEVGVEQVDGLGFSVFSALVMAITRAIAHKSFQEEGMAEDAGRLNEETEKLMNF